MRESNYSRRTLLTVFCTQSVDVKIQFYLRLRSIQSIPNTNDNLHVFVFGWKSKIKKMTWSALLFFLLLFVPLSPHYDRVEFEPSNLEFMQITSFCIQKRCVPTTHRVPQYTSTQTSPLSVAWNMNERKKPPRQHERWHRNILNICLCSSVSLCLSSKRNEICDNSHNLSILYSPP